MVIQEGFQRILEPWRWWAQWLAIGSWQPPTKSIIEADPLTTTQEIAQDFNISHSMVVWHLKQIEKVKKFNKWVPHELTTSQKHCCFQVLSSLILCNDSESFLDQIATCNKVYFTQQPVATMSVVGLRSCKALSKTKLTHTHTHTHTQRSWSLWVVCYQSHSLQLSESWQIHYVWKLCSANQWNAPKPTMPAAGTGP